MSVRVPPALLTAAAGEDAIMDDMSGASDDGGDAAAPVTAPAGCDTGVVDTLVTGGLCGPPAVQVDRAKVERAECESGPECGTRDGSPPDLPNARC